MAILTEARRINSTGYPSGLLAWQPHLRMVTNRAQKRGDERGSDLLSNTLGYHLHVIGDYEGARPYFEQALEINRKVLGEDHPDTATSLNNLGILHYYEGKFRIAFDLMHRALGIRLNVLGPDHPDTHSTQQSLTVIKESLKKTG